MWKIEYRSSVVHRSWQLPVNIDQPHRKVEAGFWIRETIDRPYDASQSNGVLSSYREVYQAIRDRDIRLLTLRPGTQSDPIDTSLQIVSLDDQPAYDAISYVWGDSTSQKSINVNGLAMSITSSLFATLHQLRSQTEHRVVWVDAICINQQDLVEKNTQVQLMREIYATGTRVVAFIGASGLYTGMGMEVLRDWSETAAFSETAAWRMLPVDRVVRGLHEVLNREWFKRSWTTQEGAVAKVIVLVCGPDVLEWKNTCRQVLFFMRAVKLAMVSPQWRESMPEQVELEPILDLLQMQLDSGPESGSWAQRSRTPDLLELVYSTRKRHATDLRDKIWSVIGLASPQERAALVVDYSQSAEDSFRAFAEIALARTRILCDPLEAATSCETPMDHDLERSAGSSTDGRVELVAAQRRAEDDAVYDVPDRRATTHLESKTRSKNTDQSCRRASMSSQAEFLGTTVCVPQDPAHDNTFNPELDAFVRGICFEAIAKLRSNDSKQAARILEDAAMLLRSESFASL